MNFCFALCLLCSNACPVIAVLFVLYRNMVFSSGIMLSLIGANARFCCTYFDVFLRHIDRLNKQFVLRVHQQRVIMSEFNKINVIKELLNVKYNFTSVPVLDLADIVFSIESLCTEWSFYFPLFERK